MIDPIELIETRRNPWATKVDFDHDEWEMFKIDSTAIIAEAERRQDLTPDEIESMIHRGHEIQHAAFVESMLLTKETFDANMSEVYTISTTHSPIGDLIPITRSNGEIFGLYNTKTNMVRLFTDELLCRLFTNSFVIAYMEIMEAKNEIK